MSTRKTRTEKKEKKFIEVKCGGNVVVKIYRNKRVKNGTTYPFFQVADYSGGKRKLVSFSSEIEARELAEDIGTKLYNQDGAVLKLTSEDRHSYLRAMELLKPTGLSLELAAAQVAEAHKKLGGRSILEAVNYFVKQHPVTLPKKTVTEAVQEMLAAKRTEGLSERHIEDLQVRLARFAADFQCQLAGLTASQIREWIQALKMTRKAGSPKPIANRTKNNFRLSIQTLCSFAKSREYLPRDWMEMDKVSVWKATQSEIEIFTPEEMATLLSIAPENMVPFLAIGAFAGLRSAEIERLDWAKVDLKSGYITVGADIAKTNSRRLVPMTENLKAWLNPRAKSRGPVVEVLNVPNAIQRLIEKTRPTDPEEPRKELPPAIPWKHNGLRHSFCSYRMADVKSAAQVALEAGNSPAMIFKFYRELVTAEQGKAWFSIMPSKATNIIAVA